MNSNPVVPASRIAMTTSLLFALLLIVGIGRSEPVRAPIVSQLHVVSIHVQDSQSFDAMFRLLGALKLPRIYGELSKPEDKGQRLYAGFSLGNAYLEPCGPYRSDAPFSPDRTARFFGLTFAVDKSIAASAGEMAGRGIASSGIIGTEGNTQFLYLNDPLLTGKQMGVSIWQIADKNDKANLEWLSSPLTEAAGGELGVKSLEEVRIGSTNLTRWNEFLSPVPCQGDLWRPAKGSALRFVASEQNQIKSIIIKVESLEKAKAALVRLKLLGKTNNGEIELDEAKTQGLQIVLRE